MKKVKEVLNNAIEKIKHMTVKQKVVAVSSLATVTVVIGGIIYYVNIPGYEEEIESNKVAQILLNKSPDVSKITNETSVVKNETSTVEIGEDNNTSSSNTSSDINENSNVSNNSNNIDDNSNNIDDNSNNANTPINNNTINNNNSNSSSDNNSSNNNSNNSNNNNSNNNNSNSNNNNSNSNNNNSNNNNSNNNNSNNNNNTNSNSNNYPAAGTINYEQTNSLNSVLIECGMQFSEETNNNIGWLPALKNYSLNGVSPTKHSLTDEWGNTNGDIIQKTISMENKTFTYDNIVPLFYRGAEFDAIAAYDGGFVNYFVARNDGSGKLNVTLYHMIIE